jgi:hypothetical protein
MIWRKVSVITAWPEDVRLRGEGGVVKMKSLLVSDAFSGAWCKGDWWVEK